MWNVTVFKTRWWQRPIFIKIAVLYIKSNFLYFLLYLFINVCTYIVCIVSALVTFQSLSWKSQLYGAQRNLQSDFLLPAIAYFYYQVLYTFWGYCVRSAWLGNDGRFQAFSLLLGALLLSISLFLLQRRLVINQRLFIIVFNSSPESLRLSKSIFFYRKHHIVTINNLFKMASIIEL